MDRIDVYCLKDDGTFHSKEGAIRHFGLEEFVERVISEDHCFVCGFQLNAVSKEHILPDWLLRREALHSKTITLPNGARTSYGRYVVPCCPPCNASLSSEYEDPISKAFRGGFRTFSQFFEKEPLKVFCWLALIYFKTHLKDLYFKRFFDPSLGEEKIASLYHWPDFHHIHALFRANLVGNKIDPSIIGSMVLMEISLDEKQDSFDYRDHHITQSIFLRSGDVGVCAIFDDCCQALAMIEDIVGVPEKIGPLQCLEILTDMQAAALHLMNRPLFRTEFNRRNGEFTLRAELPDRPEMIKFDPQIRGSLMEFNFAQHLSDDESQRQHVRSGFATAMTSRTDKLPTSGGRG